MGQWEVSRVRHCVLSPHNASNTWLSNALASAPARAYLFARATPPLMKAPTARALMMERFGATARRSDLHLLGLSRLLGFW